jgi:hypothetical protein
MVTGRLTKKSFGSAPTFLTFFAAPANLPIGAPQNAVQENGVPNAKL